MYDVIVIGAGPSGATCSKILAENGLKVLLVEKFKLPRYKSCSGQIIKKTVDLVYLYYGSTIPESVMCLPIENRGMVFTDDKGRCSTYEQPGFNVWRSSFDHWLTKQANSVGVDVIDNTQVIDCRSNDTEICVTLCQNGTKTIKHAKYIVDCEGAIGALKHRILNSKSDYIMTYQTYNIGSIDLDYHYFYAYLQPELSEYDAWFNVKDNQLVLGVSVKNYDKTAQYYSSFINYMKANHSLQITKQLKEDKWLMPRIKPGCPIDYGKGRIFFAGEVAGFLNPMGEGISAGLESGYCIAKSIIEHFNNLNDIYSAYKSKTQDLHSYMIRQWDLVGCMTETFNEMKTI